jgi:hypothetical protein
VFWVKVFWLSNEDEKGTAAAVAWLEALVAVVT